MFWKYETTIGQAVIFRFFLFAGAALFAVAAILTVWGGNYAVASVSVGISSVSAYLFVRSRGKFGAVKLADNKIAVRQGDLEFETTWSDIKSFRTIPFCTPPLYRFAYHSRPQVTYFAASSFAVIDLGFWTCDFSGMGRYIRKQMRGNIRQGLPL
jgi:hypothetical protein